MQKLTYTNIGNNRVIRTVSLVDINVVSITNFFVDQTFAHSGALVHIVMSLFLKYFYLVKTFRINSFSLACRFDHISLRVTNSTFLINIFCRLVISWFLSLGMLVLWFIRNFMHTGFFTTLPFAVVNWMIVFNSGLLTENKKIPF